jgi:hypothetical protein
MATPPPKQVAVTRDNFDDVEDDGRSDEPAPDGGYGWICVAACFTVNCFTWGTVSVSLCCADLLAGMNYWLSLHTGLAQNAGTALRLLG